MILARGQRRTPFSRGHSQTFVDKIAGQVLAAMAREEPLSPAMVLVLIRQLHDDRARRAWPTGLSAALHGGPRAPAVRRHCPTTARRGCCAFAGGRQRSDDERVGERSRGADRGARSEWPGAESDSPQAMRGWPRASPPSSWPRRVLEDPRRLMTACCRQRSMSSNGSSAARTSLARAFCRRRGAMTRLARRSCAAAAALLAAYRATGAPPVRDAGGGADAARAPPLVVRRCRPFRRREGTGGDRRP